MVKYREIPPAAAANQIAENARIPPSADLQKNKVAYLLTYFVVIGITDTGTDPSRLLQKHLKILMFFLFAHPQRQPINLQCPPMHSIILLCL